MRIRTVLFDLFGTLVPCYPLRALSTVLDEMARDIGVPSELFEMEWTRTLPNRFRGEFATLEDNLSQVLERLGGCCRRDAIEAAARRRIAFERATLVPRPEATAVLGGLRSKGVRVGLVSNCSIETVLAWHDNVLAGYMDHASFSCVVRADKPDAAIYLDALTALESAPRASLFVGDGSSDELAGAERLGMKAILSRAEDDDGTFPGRIAPSDWHGAAVSQLADVCQFIEAGSSRSQGC